MEEIAWNIIDKYFVDNPYNLVAHHIDSFDQFVEENIPQIFKENNPIKYLEKETNVSDSQISKQCNLFLGGKNADKIYIGKPIIYDEESGESHPHFMFPNEARLRNMSYSLTIHYDIEAEFIYKNNEGEIITKMETISNVYLGRFPIMIQSKYCILNGLNKEVRFNMGECRNDIGGYFIVDGKEKVIVSQEKFADNMLYVKEHKKDDIFKVSAEIRSVSEDISKPIRYSSVRLVSPGVEYSNLQFVVDIPNVRRPIPLFILMRALGITSDKAIIETCLLNLEKNDWYIDFFIPSIHDVRQIFNQSNALEYIATFTKRQTVSSALDILTNYFLPHIGENNFIDKAFFIGYMVLKILKVETKQELPTDRDSFRFKRVETTGVLLNNLFREYFILQNKNISLQVDKEFYYHMVKYENNPEAFTTIFNDKANVKKIFSDMIVETGIKKAFKGNWGGSANTKKVGIVQDLNRLSYFTYISHVRKINLPMDSSSKAVGPHKLHNSQWGIIDPVDTPDGGNVGLHKHLAIATKCSIHMSYTSIKKWLIDNAKLRLITEYLPYQLFFLTKVFVNGIWVGVLDQPIETIELFKLYRSNGIIPVYVSIRFLYKENEIQIFSDAGRLLRPIFYKDYKGKLSFDRPNVLELLEQNKISWVNIVSGLADKTNIDKNISNSNNVYSFQEIYKETQPDKIIDFLYTNSSLIQYIDTSEEESSLIAYNMEQIVKNKLYTNLEIHGSLIFGVMGNSIIFPENNQLPRDVFSCGQSRQAVSVYHSNYQMRIDKMGVILNYGQTPIVKSRYLEYINQEQQPYGVNTVVAIMSYSGYNVEDAILINEGSIKRGMFNTTYFTSYETRESTEKISGSTMNSTISNIEKIKNISNLKPNHDYSFLDHNGLIKENTEVNDKIIIIGKVDSQTDSTTNYLDNSVKTKKGQLGYVDKSFLTDGEQGQRIAKVRIREERIPNIGDKMASRAGQKGTIGLIIPEADMPFTDDGLRPDLIINPHAIPSRMTIGQLIESVLGKLGLTLGYYGDSTAFQNKGSNLSVYGNMLVKNGFEASGNELMYSGYTGEQLSGNIFIGPTYYMRLKHMVKDKINFRARGPRNVLTRQTVQGRANDGGLRIGEMERDGILAHGASYMLNESYMVRGDEYYMAICNKSGAIAVYNKSLNIFYSPFSDGPIHFTKDQQGLPILDVYSKFGRSFSIVRVPYSLKLLIQELQVLNIQMRIITEKNIDQLLNMSFSSKNMETLLQYRSSKKLQERVSTLIEKELADNGQDNGQDNGEDNGEDIVSARDAVIYLYKQELKTKMLSEVNVEQINPELRTEDIQKNNIGDEVVYLNDENKNRKWKVEKIIDDSALIKTTDINNIPKYSKLSSNRQSAILLVNQIKLIPYNEFINEIEDTPTPTPSKESNPNSPVYNPNSPVYNPNSPAYNPNSQNSQNSPTPAYNPNSQNSQNSPTPAYNPNSQNSQNSPTPAYNSNSQNSQNSPMPAYNTNSQNSQNSPNKTSSIELRDSNTNDENKYKILTEIKKIDNDDIDFDNQNYISTSKPITSNKNKSTGNEKMDILDVEEPTSSDKSNETNVEENDTVKNLFNITGL
jgi:DNA-directed RNA polymerase II subunit RPB2